MIFGMNSQKIIEHNADCRSSVLKYMEHSIQIYNRRIFKIYNNTHEPYDNLFFTSLIQNISLHQCKYYSLHRCKFNLFTQVRFFFFT